MDDIYEYDDSFECADRDFNETDVYVLTEDS